MKKSKNAFTMIELVFVIVVLGILAAVAVPKLAVTRDDAEVAKIRADIGSIRSAIATERQTRLIRGDSKFITALDAGVAVDTDNVPLFDGNGSSMLLQYGVYTAKNSNLTPVSGKWLKKATNQYTVNAGGSVIIFDYDNTNGNFDCNHSISGCVILTR